MPLYYVRHGQTDWNLAYVIQGRVDIPLNDTGIAEAKKIKEALKGVSFDAIYSSPLLRAKQTAEIISEGRETPIQIDFRIAEQYYGEFEGKSRSGEAYLKQRQSITERYPGGEGYFDVAARVYSFLRELEQNHHDENILVVAHGGISRVVESYFHSLKEDEFVHYCLANCEAKVYQWPNRNFDTLLNSGAKIK